MSYAKGEAPRDAEYAKGGAKLGRTRDFIKEPDGADQLEKGFKVYKNPSMKEDSYGKPGADTVAKGSGECGPQTKREGDKCLPTVKPRM